MWMAPGSWIAVQINNTCDRARRAIEIIAGLGTFSFKDQPIKVRLEVHARAVRAVLLRIRGTGMHVAHYQTNRAHYADMQIDVHEQSRGSRGTPPRTCVRATSRSPALSRAAVSREIAKLHSNGLISTADAITIE